MSKKQKKVSMTLNYIEHLLILASAVTGCIWISAFVLHEAVLINFTNFTAKTPMLDSLV